MVATLDFCTVETLADFVTRLRARRPRSRIAGVARVSEDLILRIEKGLTLNPRYETLERLAPALGTTVDEMLARIVAGATTTPLPDDVEPAPEKLLPIPEWDAEIAAGDWMDASTCQLDDQMHRDIIARGLFIVRVRGDSMLPTYKPGDRVGDRRLARTARGAAGVPGGATQPLTGCRQWGRVEIISTR